MTKTTVKEHQSLNWGQAKSQRKYGAWYREDDKEWAAEHSQWQGI